MPVRALEPAVGGARIRLDGGAALFARRVVVCTNAYTSFDVGERLRALPVHSFMMVTAPIDREVLVRDGDFTVEMNVEQAFHRMHGGRMLFGGADKLVAPRGHDFAIPDRVRAQLSAQLQRRVRTAAVTEAWGGRFHATASGLPIIRGARAHPAVVLNVGYGGTGVALTLTCARLAAAVASELQPSSDDARLLATIRDTRISARDSLRAIGRMARRLVMR
jgi:glycine/D-amino acid oxidase-like deaminating enzyme